MQGRSANGTAPDAAALVPAEVLALVSASPEGGGGAGDNVTDDHAITQVAWDGRHCMAAASASGLCVFNLDGLKERLAAADACQVWGVATIPAPGVGSPDCQPSMLPSLRLLVQSLGFMLV